MFKLMVAYWPKTCLPFLDVSVCLDFENQNQYDERNEQISNSDQNKLPCLLVVERQADADSSSCIVAMLLFKFFFGSILQYWS